MGQLTSSIVRGFGFTLGRMGAQAAVQSIVKEPTKNPYKSANAYYCYTEQGYEEGDYDIKFDYNRRSYQGVGNWILISLGMVVWVAIPYVNIFLWLITLLSFSKTQYLHFYKMEYKTFRISDRRYKDGYREITSLRPVYERSDVDTSYPKGRWITGIIIFLMISIYWTYFIHNL